MPWWTVLPFGLLLAAIAILPLIPALAQRWERPTWQLPACLLLGLAGALPAVAYGHGLAVGQSVIEYGQFIVLLTGLFVVSGGIALTGDLAGTPKVNTIMLGVGAVLASFIGTTGAAMLLIRPLLRSNGHRQRRAHLVIFAIFIVANTGGLLTPLGDPPLFLGFLRGVPFGWTLRLWPEWLLVNGLLLLTFYCLDRAFLRQEDPSKDIIEPLRIVGWAQLIWFGLIIVAVAVVPSIEVGGAGWWSYVPWRELVIATAAVASWLTAPRRVRFAVNDFDWRPMAEVAILFSGIFLAMVPALILLDQHAAAWQISPLGFHLMTGSLSSVLDNAPTYATFFETASVSALAASPSVALVAGVPATYLAAISTGAVMWGGLTYLGNGPNFLVRSVAVHAGVIMPSFVGYLGWSLRWLLPILLTSMCAFVSGPAWLPWLGVAGAVLIVTRAVLVAAGKLPLR